MFNVKPANMATDTYGAVPHVGEPFTGPLVFVLIAVMKNIHPFHAINEFLLTFGIRHPHLILKKKMGMWTQNP